MATGDRSHPSARGFGAAMLFVGALVAWRLRHLGAWQPAAAAAVGVGLALLSWLAPERATPLALGWLRVGEAIGRVTTPVILTLVFVVVVTPTRLLMALARVDPLSRRFTRSATTYWEERREAAFTREGFERPW